MYVTDTSAAAGAPTSTIDFIKALFVYTKEPVYVCSFANERHDETQAAERHLMTRQPGQIASFMTKWDKQGRGMFVCMATIDGDKRNKANTRESPSLFADVDPDKIDGNPDRNEMLKQLARLKLLPSALVWSGSGVHPYWFLKEALPTQANMERIEAVLRQLADTVAGDLPVCEVSRVLRLPGSHNSKRGERNEVEIIELHPDRRYDIEEIEEWLSEQSPVMLRKVREHAVPAGKGDAFEQYLKEYGIKPPIDVEQRLEQMMFMGGGESCVHQTQLVVTASMLSRGMTQDDVVTIVLEYTKRAAGTYGGRWNWRREEKKLNGMCDSWLAKHPPDARKIKEAAEATQREIAIAERAARPELKIVEKKEPVAKAAGSSLEEPDQPKTTKTSSGDNVVALPVIIKNDDPHVQLGRAVLTEFKADGEQLINTKQGSWFYSNGVWEMLTDKQWLNVRIEQSCVSFNFKSNTKLINEARNWIERRPELWRRHDSIPWDQHGKIPTRTGLIDPKTGEWEDMRPDHFCTWRVDVEYDSAAQCPFWEQMIADMFADKDEHEQIALVGVVQELMGATLIDKKPRGLAKAAVFWGNENRAKSGVLDVVAGMFGNNPIVAAIGTVDSTHGLMPFIRRAPWILHEAFGGQWHMSATVKAIITGEPVQINIKNGPIMQQTVRAPIFWATNFQPQFKESTRAIVNRMIVIEVTRAFDDKNPVGVAAEAIKRGFNKPGELIIATELPGVLNWATAGLRRALERGSIATTDSIAETADDIHRDSNLVAGFLEDCVQFDPMARLKASDFCLAHSAWFMELKGEDRRLPTNEAISKALKAMGDPRIGMNRREMRANTSRYYCGIALNRSGLDYHRTGYEGRMFEGKTATATDPQREVNSLIPVTWDTRKSVIAMRARHENRVMGDQNDDDALFRVTDQ